MKSLRRYDPDQVMRVEDLSPPLSLSYQAPRYVVLIRVYEKAFFLSTTSRQNDDIAFHHRTRRFHSSFNCKSRGLSPD
jgi:hypothetical protein